jgi:glycosyltransferase involved in cell wall biosynthesis
MASGKPVIATDSGGAKEQLGDTGVLIPPSAPDKLSTAIIELLNDPEKCRSLGLRAAERVKSFSDETFFEDLVHIYDELI